MPILVHDDVDDDEQIVLSHFVARLAGPDPGRPRQLLLLLLLHD